jgi:hypothetical protein
METNTEITADIVDDNNVIDDLEDTHVMSQVNVSQINNRQITLSNSPSMNNANGINLLACYQSNKYNSKFHNCQTAKDLSLDQVIQVWIDSLYCTFQDPALSEYVVKQAKMLFPNYQPYHKMKSILVTQTNPLSNQTCPINYYQLFATVETDVSCLRSTSKRSDISREADNRVVLDQRSAHRSLRLRTGSSQAPVGALCSPVEGLVLSMRSTIRGKTY